MQRNTCSFNCRRFQIHVRLLSTRRILSRARFCRTTPDFGGSIFGCLYQLFQGSVLRNLDACTFGRDLNGSNADLTFPFWTGTSKFVNLAATTKVCGLLVVDVFGEDCGGWLLIDIVHKILIHSIAVQGTVGTRKSLHRGIDGLVSDGCRCLTQTGKLFPVGLRRGLRHSWRIPGMWEIVAVEHLFIRGLRWLLSRKVRFIMVKETFLHPNIFCLK